MSRSSVTPGAAAAAETPCTAGSGPDIRIEAAAATSAAKSAGAADTGTNSAADAAAATGITVSKQAKEARVAIEADALAAATTVGPAQVGLVGADGLTAACARAKNDAGSGCRSGAIRRVGEVRRPDVAGARRVNTDAATTEESAGAAKAATAAILVAISRALELPPTALSFAKFTSDSVTLPADAMNRPPPRPAPPPPSKSLSPPSPQH